VLLSEGDKARASDLSELLYETSLLTSGFALDQPRDYASKVRAVLLCVVWLVLCCGGWREGLRMGVKKRKDRVQCLIA